MVKMIESPAEKALSWVNRIILIFFACSTIYPFLYILGSSLSSGPAVQEGRIFLFPVDFTAAAYRETLFDWAIWRAYGNTFFYTIFGTATAMFFTITGAYALSRPKLPGKTIIAFLVVLTLWFKPGMIPFYLNIRDLGLMDSRTGIILGFAVNAFNVVLLRNYFESIPQSLEEAAAMDGLNVYQVLWYIILPSSKPALTTVALFYAIARWNGYFWAMVLLKTEKYVPLQVLLRKLIVEVSTSNPDDAVNFGQAYSSETLIYATIIIAIVPVVILYPFIQKYFNKGLLLGGVKE